jgi:hypothetical protein
VSADAVIRRHLYKCQEQPGCDCPLCVSRDGGGEVMEDEPRAREMLCEHCFADIEPGRRHDCDVLGASYTP